MHKQAVDAETCEVAWQGPVQRQAGCSGVQLPGDLDGGKGVLGVEARCGRDVALGVDSTLHFARVVGHQCMCPRRGKVQQLSGSTAEPPGIKHCNQSHAPGRRSYTSAACAGAAQQTEVRT